MKIKTNRLSLIILLSFIIILIIYLLYINKIASLQGVSLQGVSLQSKKEGFISKIYRPYYRIFKRGLHNYYNYFLNY